MFGLLSNNKKSKTKRNTGFGWSRKKNAMRGGKKTGGKKPEGGCRKGTIWDGKKCAPLPVGSDPLPGAHTRFGRSRVTRGGHRGPAPSELEKCLAKCGKGDKACRDKCTGSTIKPKGNPNGALQAEYVALYDAVNGVLVSSSPSLDGVAVELIEMEAPDEFGRTMVRVRAPHWDANRSLHVPLYEGEGTVPCFDVSTGTFVGGPYDGAQAPEGTWVVSPDGTMVTVSLGGDVTGELPVCATTEEPPTSECCVDVDAMVLVCDDPNHPLHGVQVVSIQQIDDNGLVHLIFLDPTTGAQTRGQFMLCEEPPDFEGCCYDAVQGIVVCDDPNHPMHGQPMNPAGEPTADGMIWVCPPNVDPTSSTAPACIQLPLCEQPSLDCCYDLASGVLLCSDGSTMEVSLLYISETTPPTAAVEHPSLPGGTATFPLCEEETPPDCCYDGSTSTLVCDDDTLNGKPAAVVSQRQTADGRTLVTVAWEGGMAEMELCSEECPPSFCCVNLTTGLFVCPGEPDLHGQPADIADVVSQNGFNWAVLSDGTQVPVCGEKVPPPQLCPDCPPGMWLSPDKECVDIPGCPTCPPGYLLDTQTGECVECPPDGGCPTCPPGYLLDTQTGQCVKCPPDWTPPGWTPPPGDCDDPCSWEDCQFGICGDGSGWTPPPPRQLPPQTWWEDDGHCCEDCAVGLDCAGCMAGNPEHGDGQISSNILRYMRGRSKNPDGRKKYNCKWGHIPGYKGKKLCCELPSGSWICGPVLKPKGRGGKTRGRGNQIRLSAAEARRFGFR